MKLADLLRSAGLAGEGDATVTGFAIDHRKVAPGTVFGAFAGARFNGEDFIADAVASGAVAVVAAPGAVVEGGAGDRHPLLHLQQLVGREGDGEAIQQVVRVGAQAHQERAGPKKPTPPTGPGAATVDRG